MGESFSLERDVREKCRDQILHDLIIKAVGEARRVQRSMKCAHHNTVGAILHSYMEDGCINDGTGCLCECHDVTVQPPRWEDGKHYRRASDKHVIDYRCVHVWPNGEALMAWGDSASCRLTPARRSEFHEVVTSSPVVDDGSDNNTFRESM